LQSPGYPNKKEKSVGVRRGEARKGLLEAMSWKKDKRILGPAMISLCGNVPGDPEFSGPV
jgi:hypothetical protein